MAELKVVYGALFDGATSTRNAASAMETEDTDHYRNLMNSAEFWSDENGINGALGASSQVWRTHSQASHQEAHQRAGAIDQSNEHYQGCSRQVNSIMSQYDA